MFKSSTDTLFKVPGYRSLFSFAQQEYLWIGAYNACQRNGGALVVIHNEAEYNDSISFGNAYLRHFERYSIFFWTAMEYNASRNVSAFKKSDYLS